MQPGPGSQVWASRPVPGKAGVAGVAGWPAWPAWGKLRARLRETWVGPRTLPSQALTSVKHKNSEN